jgi:hypothetical protein
VLLDSYIGSFENLQHCYKIAVRVQNLVIGTGKIGLGIFTCGQPAAASLGPSVILSFTERPFAERSSRFSRSLPGATFDMKRSNGGTRPFDCKKVLWKLGLWTSLPPFHNVTSRQRWVQRLRVMSADITMTIMQGFRCFTRPCMCAISAPRARSRCSAFAPKSTSHEES